MFSDLSTFEKYISEIVLSGLSTFGKVGWETMFPGWFVHRLETWLGNSVCWYTHLLGYNVS
jgi:hypothetical protein